MFSVLQAKGKSLKKDGMNCKCWSHASDVLNWANCMVKTRKISDFKYPDSWLLFLLYYRDSHLSNALFLIDLLSAISPLVDHKYVITKEDSEFTDAEKIANAKYAISGKQLFCSF